MKGDPLTEIMKAMSGLREKLASDDGSQAVPRQSSQTQAFGNNPTQKVMAEPGETYIPPQIAGAPNVLKVLKSINKFQTEDSMQWEEGQGVTKTLSQLYQAVMKPVRAWSVGMSLLGAMTGPVDNMNKVALHDKDPLNVAVSVAEKVAGLRKNRGEQMVTESLYKHDAAVGKKFGGLIEPTVGTTGSDSEPTMMEPGGFVVNARASADPQNKEFLQNLMVSGGAVQQSEPPPSPMSLFGDVQQQPKDEGNDLAEILSAIKGLKSNDDTVEMKTGGVLPPQQPSLFNEPTDPADSNPDAPSDDQVERIKAEIQAAMSGTKITQPIVDAPVVDSAAGDQPPHLDMDVTRLQTKDEPERMLNVLDAESRGVAPVDFSQISKGLGQFQKVHAGISRISGNGDGGLNLGWGSAPDFHQGLYGRPPSAESRESGKFGLKSEDIKKATMVATMVAAPELALPMLAGGGGEAAIFSKILGGGGGGAGIESMLGGLGGGGGKAAAGEGLFGGGGIDQLMGMFSDKQGSAGGGDDDMKTLIKAVMDLVNQMKGGSEISADSDASWGPTASPVKTQGSNYGAILRNMGR